MMAETETTEAQTAEKKTVGPRKAEQETAEPGSAEPESGPATEENAGAVRPRRKGQPLPKKERTVTEDVLRLGVMMGLGLLLIFGVFFFFSKAKEIIRFSYD